MPGPLESSIHQTIKQHHVFVENNSNPLPSIVLHLYLRKRCNMLNEVCARKSQLITLHGKISAFTAHSKSPVPGGASVFMSFPMARIP
jgi:hypothetical protein